MGISLFNKPTYKRFGITARYSEEEKSDFEQRMGNWRKKQNSESNFDKESFKQELKLNWNHSRPSQNHFNMKYSSFRRTLVFMVILAVLIWAIFYLSNKYLV